MSAYLRRPTEDELDFPSELLVAEAPSVSESSIRSSAFALLSVVSKGELAPIADAFAQLSDLVREHLRTLAAQGSDREAA